MFNNHLYGLKMFELAQGLSSKDWEKRLKRNSGALRYFVDPSTKTKWDNF